MKQRFELNLESDRLVTRKQRLLMNYWCNPCSGLVEMLPVEIAAAASFLAPAS